MASVNMRRMSRTGPGRQGQPAGEGYRKIRARLRREHGAQVSGNGSAAAAPRGTAGAQRVRGRRKPRPHDGTIIPEAPNQRWGTDATIAWTRTDGWVWVFALSDTVDELRQAVAG
jgi:putative transposase